MDRRALLGLLRAAGATGEWRVAVAALSTDPSPARDAAAASALPLLATVACRSAAFHSAMFAPFVARRLHSAARRGGWSDPPRVARVSADGALRTYEAAALSAGGGAAADAVATARADAASLLDASLSVSWRWQQTPSAAALALAPSSASSVGDARRRAAASATAGSLSSLPFVRASWAHALFAVAVLAALAPDAGWGPPLEAALDAATTEAAVSLLERSRAAWLTAGGVGAAAAAVDPAVAAARDAASPQTKDLRLAAQGAVRAVLAADGAFGSAADNDKTPMRSMVVWRGDAAASLRASPLLGPPFGPSAAADAGGRFLGAHPQRVAAFRALWAAHHAAVKQPAPNGGGGAADPCAAFSVSAPPVLRGEALEAVGWGLNNATHAAARRSGALLAPLPSSGADTATPLAAVVVDDATAQPLPLRALYPTLLAQLMPSQWCRGVALFVDALRGWQRALRDGDAVRDAAAASGVSARVARRRRRDNAQRADGSALRLRREAEGALPFAALLAMASEPGPGEAPLVPRLSFQCDAALRFGWSRAAAAQNTRNAPPPPPRPPPPESSWADAPPTPAAVLATRSVVLSFARFEAMMALGAPTVGRWLPLLLQPPPLAPPRGAPGVVAAGGAAVPVPWALQVQFSQWVDALLAVGLVGTAAAVLGGPHATRAVLRPATARNVVVAVITRFALEGAAFASPGGGSDASRAPAVDLPDVTFAVGGVGPGLVLAGCADGLPEGALRLAAPAATAAASPLWRVSLSVLAVAWRDRQQRLFPAAGPERTAAVGPEPKTAPGGAMATRLAAFYSDGLSGVAAVYKPPGAASQTCALQSPSPTVAEFLAASGPRQPSGGGEMAADSATSLPLVAQCGLANRLDRQTSGVLLAARGPTALLAVRRALLTHRGVLRKTYLAIVVHVGAAVVARRGVRLDGAGSDPLPAVFPLRAHGALCDAVQAVTETERRHPSRRNHTSDAEDAPSALSTAAILDSCDNSGEEGSDGAALSSSDASTGDDDTTSAHSDTPGEASAVTLYRVLRRFPGSHAALVRLEIPTGRRHQIRQHLAAQGVPVLGDRRYCPAAWRPSLIQRCALHSACVALPPLCTGDERPRVVGAALPPDMLECLRLLAEQEPIAEGFGDSDAEDPLA